MPKKGIPNEHESSDSGYKNEYDSEYDSFESESESESESEGSEEDIDWGYLDNGPSLKVETGKNDFKKALGLVKKLTKATQKLTNRARPRPRPKPGKTRRNSKPRDENSLLLDAKQLREINYKPLYMNLFEDPETGNSFENNLLNYLLAQNARHRKGKEKTIPAKAPETKETLSQKFKNEGANARPGRKGLR